MKTKACKNCKAITQTETCPVCHGNNLTASWQGRITFINVDKSFIGKQIGVEKPTEYAIKVR
ncbi:MAG: transcription elongation factor subunit Spt4 [Candidatus Woesearchaeota archaeon]